MRAARAHASTIESRIHAYLTLLSSSVEQNRGKPSSLRGLFAATSPLRESKRLRGLRAFRACSALVLFSVQSARGAVIHGTLMWALFMQLLGVLLPASPGRLGAGDTIVLGLRPLHRRPPVCGIPRLPAAR